MENKVKQLLEKHKDDKDLTTEKDYIRPGWDWSGADLNGWNFSGLKLSKWKNQANFEGADLTNARLQGTDLFRARLQKANLSNAQLQGVNLISAQLQKANLINAQLQKANLINAQLQGANLFNAQLQKANLSNAQLQKTDLSNAQLQKTNLFKSQLKEANLSSTQLQGANLSRTQLQKANLSYSNLRDAEFNERTDLQDVNLFQCKLENSTIKNAYNNLDKIVIQEKEKKYLEAKEVYLILKNYFREEGLYDISGKYYYREKLMERACNRQNRQWGKWFFNHLLEKVAGYGERPERVICWWIGLILLFAIIYIEGNGITMPGNSSYNLVFREALYFSGVTFTTLGFGDLAPKPGIFQIFSLLEAFLGAIFIAMFIFVFARKMTK